MTRASLLACCQKRAFVFASSVRWPRLLAFASRLERLQWHAQRLPVRRDRDGRFPSSANSFDAYTLMPRARPHPSADKTTHFYCTMASELNDEDLVDYEEVRGPQCCVARASNSVHILEACAVPLFCIRQDEAVEESKPQDEVKK